MNPLHLELLVNDRIADRRRVTSESLAAWAIRAGDRHQDEEGHPARRMPRGPRLRAPRIALGRGIRDLRLLVAAHGR